MLFGKYNASEFKIRYHRYRVLFFVSFAISFAGFLCACAINDFGIYENVVLSVFLQLFLKILTFESLILLAVFLFGITVYSPFVQFSLSLLKGISYGLAFFGTMGNPEIGVFQKIVILLYCLISSVLFSSFASFCTSVSLRLFSDGITFSLKKEENRIFGGTLFNSLLFCNTVNFRFLFSYFVIFSASIFCQGVLSLIYAFFISI